MERRSPEGARRDKIATKRHNNSQRIFCDLLCPFVGRGIRFRYLAFIRMPRRSRAGSGSLGGTAGDSGGGAGGLISMSPTFLDSQSSAFVTVSPIFVSGNLISPMWNSVIAFNESRVFPADATAWFQ